MKSVIGLPRTVVTDDSITLCCRWQCVDVDRSREAIRDRMPALIDTTTRHPDLVLLVRLPYLSFSPSSISITEPHMPPKHTRLDLCRRIR